MGLCEQGLCGQCWCQFIYMYVCMYICIYIYVCDPKKGLSTLFIDSHFQTVVVDFLSNNRLALTLHAPEMLSSLSKSRISLFNAHFALFVRRSHTPICMYH